MKRKRTARSRAWAGLELLEKRCLLSAAPTLPIERAHPTFALMHEAGAAPASSTGPTGIAPASLRHTYGADAISFGTLSGDGSGQTIAIIDAFDNPNAASDLHNFDVTYGLPDPPSFTKLNEDGGTSLPGVDSADTKPNTWELEESLDVQWAHVMAPAANIILYEASSTSFSDLVVSAVNTARNNPGVSVISMSFGAGEFSGETSYDSYFTTPAGHQGITFLASTGDTGSPGGYPAFSPNVVAAGGTSLSVGTGGVYLSETAWSKSGGGSSTQESEPSYQASVQSSGVRTTPDVAMDADPYTGVPIYDTYDGSAAAPWIQIGGTSLAAPLWGGLIAVADQGRIHNGLATLDSRTGTLPQLYQAPAVDYHDITTGSNGGFSAGIGYDEVTGRGSPFSNLLIPALAGTPSNPAPPPPPASPPPPPPPATASSATFLKTDTTTEGSWSGAYGTQGWWVEGVTANFPSYAQISASGYGLSTWTSSTTDVRAPEIGPGASSRTAGQMYSTSSFSIDLNLTDGKAHEISLYLLDWDSASRAETITISDAASGTVLNTQGASNFHNGQWLDWNLSGHVKLNFALITGATVDLSAMMFDPAGTTPTPPPPVSPPPPASSATFLKSDTTTEGSWSGPYGTQGWWVEGMNANFPSYAQVAASSYGLSSWAPSTTDVRAPQTGPGATSRTAGQMYSTGAFTIDLNLTDGKTHEISLYLLDWDSASRAETITISDAASGTVLNSQSAANFHNGQWLDWNVSGHVKITFTRTAGATAELSAVMFDPGV